MDAKYRVVLARVDHIDSLADIERAAATLFRGRVPESLLADVTERQEFVSAQAAGRLWVALRGDIPVGFAHVDLLPSGLLHLEEIDVDPIHARQGLGSALIEAVCAWAAEAGHGSITLTTFRDIPWNMPFYERRGFDEVPPECWSEELAAVVRDEATRGLEPELRVVMRRGWQQGG